MTCVADARAFLESVTALPRFKNALFASRLLGCFLTLDGLKLAIEGGAADSKAARHLGHLAAIVGNRESDHLGLDLLDRPNLAFDGQQRQRCRCRSDQRGNGYVGTRKRRRGVGLMPKI